VSLDLLRRLRRLAPLLSVLIFGFALFLLHRELADFRFHQVIEFLEALPAERLLLAFGCTLLGYLALAGYDVLGFRYAQAELPLHRVGLASFVGYAVSNALGHPLFTGTPLRARFYTGWGISGVDVARVLSFSLATFWLGFFTLSGATFVLEPIAVPAFFHLGGLTARPLGILLLGLVLAYGVASIGFRGTLAIFGLELELPAPGLALSQIALGSLDWSLAAAVLYALLPESWEISFPAFLSAFLLAQVGGLLSQVPAGLGVFETLMVLLLPRTFPRTDVLGALVAYRAVYYLMPLLVAALLLAGREVVARRAQVGRIARAVSVRAPAIVPQVLSLATFVAGCVLLVSGATPAVGSRLRFLDAIVPLPLIEASHLLGSLAGVALLFLARGLQRRLDAAYQLTVGLLVAGIAASLLKGLDWEEAGLLAITLCALVPCRRHFHRGAALTGESFTPAWIAAIAIVLGGTIWLGFFAFKHVEYSRDLWWHFTLFGNAPRFLRASVGALALVIGFSFYRLLRPVQPEPQLPVPAELDRALDVAARSSRTAAYLALLGDKQLLWSEKGEGFLMFGVQGRSWIAMGDPVGPEEQRADLAWRFRELVDRHGGWPVFYQVSGEGLPLYVDLGLSLVKLGEEARVPLAEFNLEGSGRKKLRHALRRVEELGFRFEVAGREEVPRLLPELAAISDEWLRLKSVREKGFSLGFFSPDYLSRTPLALVRSEAGIVAFANFWLAASGTELSIDLMRHREAAPPGVMDFLFLHVMLWGKEQGYAWFNLGMAPLSGLEARALAPLWAKLGALVYRHGEHFYNFQGLRQYKEKFDPVWEPRYLAAPGGFALPRVLTDLAALTSRGLRGVFSK